MTEIIVVILLIWNVLLTATIVRFFDKYKKSVVDTIKALDGLAQIAENTVGTIGEHQKLHKSQDELNKVLSQYLEFLAIHTKLIKPTIGFEAEQFLAWYNKKKEDNNG